MKQFLLYICVFLWVTTYAQNNKVVVKISTHNKSANTVLNDIKTSVKGNYISFNQFYKTKKKSNTPNKYNMHNIYILHLTDETNQNEVIKSIKYFKDIEYVEPYPISYTFNTPNDPLINNQYNLDITKTYAAHNISKGDTNVVIGIVDTGIDLLHEDLKNNIKYNYHDPINNIDDDGDGFVDNYYGWDVADDDNNPQNNASWSGVANYHGTNVAGIASATTNNGVGIASIGYHTKILPIKAMDGSGAIIAGYEGIMYAATHGCQIINLSWGNNIYSQFAQDVINYVTNEYGCLVIAAAGNKRAATDKRPDTWFYPASYDNVFSVAATGPTDQRWTGSSYAITVDVSAPGQGLYTTDQFDSYKYTYGTSSAAPMAAGLAGLIKAHRPNFTNKQLAEQIRITSDHIDTLSENIPYSKQLGYGRINALRALSNNNLPSIRIDSFNVSCLNNYNCDTLSISFIATNYLAQATNTTIELTCNSDYIIPLSNHISSGQLNTFAQVSNTTSPFLFKVSEDMPYNELVWFEFKMNDEGYKDYQIFETVIKKDFINVINDELETTLTSNGKIGYANWENELGIGIRYKGENTISNAGIILGNGSDNMASALFSNEDFSSVTIIDTASTFEGLLGFEKLKTNNESNLNLDINHKTLLPNNEELKNSIIHTYTILNQSGIAVNELKMSQFIDWDLSHPNYNIVSFDSELNMAYTYSRTSNVIYSAICLLNDMEAIPYAFDMIAGGNGGIDITQGFSNDLKWFTMNNHRENAGNKGDSIDIASMLTTEQFDLNNDDSIEIAFAHIIGSNLNELKIKASILIEEYNKTISINEHNQSFDIFPNPAKNNIIVKLNSDKNEQITIYNSMGQTIYKASIATEETILNIDVSNLTKGIYIIEIRGALTSNTKKLIIND